MKANNKRRSKTEQMKKSIKRRGVILISVLAVLILMVNVITASYSWFTPGKVNGAGMEYVDTIANRSEQCTFKTYRGTKITSYSSGHYIDQIDYNTEITTESVPAGETKYFRTSIVNADTANASDVSLYFSSFGQANCNLTVAVIFPSNTVRTVSAAQTDYCLIRNAYVKVHDEKDVDGPGLLQVDWFVKNTGSSAVTVNVGPMGGSNANMYILYN
ncbi:MAG: hypothetical protein IJH07_04195 [Ruminococcus sp.]|nr:hypothetical protein [Ruminococcus sp.]